jgi:hypothetical protein
MKLVYNLKESKTNIATNYVELVISNKVNVHTIITSGQDILMKIVVMMITTAVSVCNICELSIADNSFCKMIPFPSLNICKNKQPTTSGMHIYKNIIPISLC